MSSELITSGPPDDGNLDIPPANRPGHHPDRDQDRPDVPADIWRLRHGDGHTIPFRFDGLAGRAARLFGARTDRDGLHLGRNRLGVTYGPWQLETSLDNLEGVAITGPYRLPKVIGPPHLSLRDRGISFSTNTEAGLCLCFTSPVHAILPTGIIRHPAVTLTIEEPERVAATLRRHLDDIRST